MDDSLSQTSTLVNEGVAYIRQQAPGFAPKALVILGSGLGAVSQCVKRVATIPYADIPGFHASTVTSHAGRLLLGHIGDTPVLMMQGRFHMYEGHPASVWLAPIRIARELGCETLFVTNAAGSLRKEIAPPCLMVISDHINGLAANPLVGLNDDDVGPRFPDMTDCWTPELAQRICDVAASREIAIHEGVYYGALGPTFETPAEVRMMAMLGGSAVGMSTVPEVICARHCGMQVCGLSAITNYTAGIADLPQTMEEVIEGGAEVSKNLSSLISGFFAASEGA